MKTLKVQTLFGEFTKTPSSMPLLAQEELEQISPEHLHERLRTCDEMCEDAMSQLRDGSPQDHILRSGVGRE